LRPDEQEVDILADLAAQCAVPINNSALFAQSMAAAAKRSGNDFMMAGLVGRCMLTLG
jgi:GAF domain-containing protein